jgi:hypothetical protein
MRPSLDTAGPGAELQTWIRYYICRSSDEIVAIPDNLLNRPGQENKHNMQTLFTGNGKFLFFFLVSVIRLP